MCPLRHRPPAGGCHQPTACHLTVSHVWHLAVVSLYDRSPAQPARGWQLTCSDARKTVAGAPLAPVLARRGVAVVLDPRVLAVALTGHDVAAVLIG